MWFVIIRVLATLSTQHQIGGREWCPSRTELEGKGCVLQVGVLGILCRETSF